MSLKDGGVWNKFKTYEDYQALDYLVALANACGFIDNNIGVELMNINLIGKDESMLISTYGREEVDDDNKWLDSIKKSIIDKVHYTVRPDEIKAYLPIQK